MKKILTLTWKDLVQLFRDRTALLLMLAAPFALTLAITFAFSGTDGGIQDIPVILVDNDGGELAQALLDVFYEEDLARLLEPSRAERAGEATRAVDSDQAAAAVIIPENFTADIFASATPGDNASVLRVYTNPARPVSSGVIVSIVHQFTERVNTANLGATVSIRLLTTRNILDPSTASSEMSVIGERAARATSGQPLIEVETEIRQAAGGDELATGTFNWMQYYASGMAILFLMFSMSSSANSLLRERDTGTYDRLKASPTYRVEILAGKMLSTFIKGLFQMGVLIAASALLLNVAWGQPLGVVLHTMLTVAVMAAMGLVIASLVKTSSQASIAGTATVLILGVISGNYFPRTNFPDWLMTISNVSPSTLGIEGYQLLAAGNLYSELHAVWLPLLALTTLLTGMAVMGFRRNLP